MAGSLRLVSREVHALATPILFKTIMLDRPSTLCSFLCLLMLGQLVKTLHVGADHQLPHDWWPMLHLDAEYDEGMSASPNRSQRTAQEGHRGLRCMARTPTRACPMNIAAHSQEQGTRVDLTASIGKAKSKTATKQPRQQRKFPSLPRDAPTFTCADRTTSLWRRVADCYWELLRRLAPSQRRGLAEEGHAQASRPRRRRQSPRPRHGYCARHHRGHGQRCRRAAMHDAS